MKTNFIFAVFISLFTFSQTLFADSPLTSTAISKAYQSEKIIQKAAEAGGLLTPKLMRYLTKKRKPIVLKIALINELGWDIDGRDNASTFFAYLQKKYNYEDMEDFRQKADGDLLICMAYLKALDNYLEVSEAISLAQAAKAKKKNSYSVQIICALIEAQKAQDSDWCKVYKLTDKVRMNQSLDKDMGTEAINIIFDYMDLYKEYC